MCVLGCYWSCNHAFVWFVIASCWLRNSLALCLQTLVAVVIIKLCLCVLTEALYYMFKDNWNYKGRGKKPEVSGKQWHDENEWVGYWLDRGECPPDRKPTGPKNKGKKRVLWWAERMGRKQQKTSQNTSAAEGSSREDGKEAAAPEVPPDPVAEGYEEAQDTYLCYV